jgi:Fis family transcriptional regulator, factor for inversion stimulation protein
VKAQLENLTLQMYKGGITYLEGVREFQKAFIRVALQEHKGNQCRTAEKLGMHRNTLSRAIRDLQLDIQSIRGTQRRRPPQRDRSGTLMKREG